MKIPSDEELCDYMRDELLKLELTAELARKGAAYNNKWKLHQELGDLLVKINQLLEDK